MSQNIFLTAADLMCIQKKLSPSTVLLQEDSQSLVLVLSNECIRAGNNTGICTVISKFSALIHEVHLLHSCKILKIVDSWKMRVSQGVVILVALYIVRQGNPIKPKKCEPLGKAHGGLQVRN